MQIRKFVLAIQSIRNKNFQWWPSVSPIWTKWANFIQNLPCVLPTKFQFIWPNVLNLANHKQELPMAVILVARSRNMTILSRIFHTSFLQINYLLCLLVSEEKIFLISANKKQELYHHKNEEKLNMDSM